MGRLHHSSRASQSEGEANEDVENDGCSRCPGVCAASPSAARVVEAGQKMQATLASINAINVIVKSELLFADKVRAKTNGKSDGGGLIGRL